MGPDAGFKDLGPLSVNGDKKIHGIRAGRVFGGRSYSFNSNLCSDPAMIGILASTMIHEAMHACPGGISDALGAPNGCSAGELEAKCTGYSSD